MGWLKITSNERDMEEENMIQFHQTGYGRDFFEHQLPQLIKAINRIADELEKMNERKSNEVSNGRDKV